MSAATRWRKREAQRLEREATQAAQAAQVAQQQQMARTRAMEADERARAARRGAWLLPPAVAPYLAPYRGDAGREDLMLSWLAMGHDRLLAIGRTGLALEHETAIINRVRSHSTRHQDWCAICGEQWDANAATTKAHVDEHAEQWLADHGYVVPGRYAERDVLADALCAAFDQMAIALSRPAAGQ